jgi:CO/xanthine dehydrogenase FAD-binding subunit
VTEYLRPDTVDGVVAALAADPTAKALAGGSDLLNQLRLRAIRPNSVVDLAGIPDLGGVHVGADGAVSIGATATMRELLAEPALAGRLAALHDAAALLGGRQIQAVATVGGNLCNASPAAETATPLLVHEATARVHGPRGSRQLPLAELFVGPGRVALRDGEVLMRLEISGNAGGYVSAYQRLDLRRSVDIAVVSASAGLWVEDGTIRTARLAIGAVAPVPMRVPAAEERLLGTRLADTDSAVAEAAARCQRAATPIDDVRAGAEYRRAMVGVVVRRALDAAVARAIDLFSTKGRRP